MTFELLEKGIQFLIPSNPLSIIVLIGQCIIFILGWRRSSRSIRNYGKNLQQLNDLNSAVPPEILLEYKNSSRSMDYSIKSIPNTLVSIGIVSTFIGLGIAIYDSSAILIEAEDLDSTKLLSVLGVIAFKFQTSVYGIILAILFVSIVGKRYDYEKHDLKSKKLLELYKSRNGLSMLVDEISNTNKTLVKTLTQASVRQKTDSTAVRNSIESLMETLKKMDTTFDTHNHAVRDTIELGLKNINDSSLSLSEQMLTITNEIKKSLESFVVSMNTATDFTMKSMESLNSDLLEATKNLDKSIDKKMDDLVHSVNELNSNTSDLLVKVDDTIIKVNDTIKLLTSKVSHQNEISDQNKEELGKLIQAINLVGQHVAILALKDFKNDNAFDIIKNEASNDTK